MSNLKDKCAFPQGHLDGPTVDPSGMTFREYAAVKVLGGLVANYVAMGNTSEVAKRIGSTVGIEAAKCALAHVDCLIEQLEKPTDAMLFLHFQPQWRKGDPQPVICCRDMAEVEKIVMWSGPQTVKPFLTNAKGETVAFVRTD